MVGAKQWRVPCPHVDERPGEVCMASEVTSSNRSHWRREDRIPDGIDASDLGDLLERASGTIVVCNSCRRVMELDGSGGIASVEWGPDPYARRCELCGERTESLTLTADCRPNGAKYLVCQHCADAGGDR